MKYMLILLLSVIDVYLLYVFQHYFGINGVEWFYYLGYVAAGGVITEAIKGLARS